MSVAFGIASLAVVVAALMAWVLTSRGQVPAFLSVGAIATAMGLEWRLASRGTLQAWSLRPPPFVLVMATLFVLTLAVAFAGPGRRVAANASFALLVGIQAFRLPLELVMHTAARQGIMPVQMSYSGWNFDIVTGALAIPVAIAAAAGRAPRWLILAWNLLGLLLLINVVTIALVSTPPVAAFGADHLNTWVADAPYVWLPGVLVLAALFGHVVMLRKMIHGRSAIG